MRKKAIWLAAGVAALLAVAAAGWWREGKALERQTVEKAVASIAEAPSLHTKAELTLYYPERQGSERTFSKVDVSYDGDLVRKDNQTESKGRFLAAARGRGNTLYAKGSLVALSDEVAFYLEQAPALLDPQDVLSKKWTYVSVPMWQARNARAIKDEIISAGQGFEHQGKEDLNGQTARRFKGVVEKDEARRLVEAMRKDSSGSNVWDLLARVLNAGEAPRVEVWIAPDGKLNKVRLEVARVNGGQMEKAAELELSFSDFGKEVALKRPPRQATAKPEAFSSLLR